MSCFLVVREQKARLSVEESPAPTFVAPGRYPEYFLANEDFLCAKSSRTMDYDMESKVSIIPMLERRIRQKNMPVDCICVLVLMGPQS